MASLRHEYLGLLSRTRLAQMLMNTYADAKNIDQDESFDRLEAALRDLKLIEGLQNAAWRAMAESRPDLTDEKRLQKAQKTLGRRSVFKAFRRTRADDGAWAALTVLIDYNAGVTTGEALGLLDTPEGERLLQRGFEVCGRLLAKEMLR